MTETPKKMKHPEMKFLKSIDQEDDDDQVYFRLFSWGQQQYLEKLYRGIWIPRSVLIPSSLEEILEDWGLEEVTSSKELDKITAASLSSSPRVMWKDSHLLWQYAAHTDESGAAVFYRKFEDKIETHAYLEQYWHDTEGPIPEVTWCPFQQHIEEYYNTVPPRYGPNLQRMLDDASYYFPLIPLDMLPAFLEPLKETLATDFTLQPESGQYRVVDVLLPGAAVTAEDFLFSDDVGLFSVLGPTEIAEICLKLAPLNKE